MLSARERLLQRVRKPPTSPPAPVERAPPPWADPRGLTDDLIESTAIVLSWRGVVEFDDGLTDAEVLAEIRLASAAYPTAVTPDALADYWLMERQEAWERSIPTWTCECGSTFKVLPDGMKGADEHFYRIVDDGLVGECVGSIRGVGLPANFADSGNPHPDDRCPDCRRKFKDTIRAQLNPQGSLFV